MTTTGTLLFIPHRRPFTISTLLSVLVHAGLLTGLGVLAHHHTVPSPPPTIHVTLVAPKIDPVSHSAPQPHLQTRPQAERFQPSPTRKLSPPAVVQKLHLEPLTPAKHEAPLPTRKRALRDQSAVSALVSRNLMKMASAKETHRSPPPPEPRSTLLSPREPVVQASLPSPAKPNRESPTLPSRAQRKTLLAHPPHGQGISASKIGVVRKLPPVYPRIAKESGWEGTVVVRVLVTTEGLPGEIHIRKTSGHPALDEAAVDAIRQWRFSPAKDGNIPIAKYVDIPLKFDLHG